MSTQQNEAERKLLVLIAEIKGTPIMDRVNAYAARFAGTTGAKTVSEFLAAKMPDKEKYIVTCNLVDILLAKDYSRLPSAGAELAPETEIGEEDMDDKEPPMDRDALRATIRSEIRAELADIFEKIARALKP